MGSNPLLDDDNEDDVTEEDGISLLLFGSMGISGGVVEDDEELDEMVVTSRDCLGTKILFLIELLELEGVDKTREVYTIEGMVAGSSSQSTEKWSYRIHPVRT